MGLIEFVEGEGKEFGGMKVGVMLCGGEGGGGEKVM